MPEIVLPLFPLPDVVHFPGTHLPLHIFEPRYRQLVAELLERPAEERRIGMIFVHRDRASGETGLVEPGCAGLLVAHEALEEGRSNIVLAGEFRFVVERELPGKPYRRALVRALDDDVPLLQAERAEELSREISGLAVAVARESGDRFPVDLAALAGLGRPERLQALTNRLAADLDLPVLRKQSLLAEPPLERAEQVAGILRSRMKVLSSLRPYRHLAAAAEHN
jgi:uncharacterized protein